MACVDIEYELEKMLVTSIQGVFAFDNKFIYNEDETLTKVSITSEYPDETVPLKQPQIIVTQISFDFNLDNSLNRNFADQIFGKNDVFMGNRYMNIIPYSVTLLCLGQYYESKDLANKLVNYVAFQASSVFDSVGLHITRVSKGASTPQAQFPTKVFQTPVSVLGNLHWVGTKTTDVDLTTMLNNIKLKLEKQ